MTVRDDVMSYLFNCNMMDKRVTFDEARTIIEKIAENSKFRSRSSVEINILFDQILGSVDYHGFLIKEVKVQNSEKAKYLSHDTGESALMLTYYNANYRVVNLWNMVDIIGPFSFMDNADLKFIKSEARIIEKYAFTNCKSLKTVSFPGVEYIDYGAFSCCQSMNKAILGNVKHFGRKCFYKCENLIVGNDIN